MTTAYFDQSFPSTRQRPYKTSWWQFWRKAEPIAPRRSVPEKQKQRPAMDWDYQPQPLSDFVPKPPPAPPPPKLDNLTELKRQLRSCTYGEFMAALSGITGEEQKPHGEIADSAWKWAIAA